MNFGEIMNCNACELSKTRTQVVMPRGSPNPIVVFIGEAPGHDEDISGMPFVGRAGKLLDKWIEHLLLKEDDYAIANVVWCRPPDNRFPLPQEVSACSVNLTEYLRTVKPKYLATLGRLATAHILKIDIPTQSKYVGNFYTLPDYKVFPLYHPAYFLRSHGDWEPMLKTLMYELIKNSKENLNKQTSYLNFV